MIALIGLLVSTLLVLDSTNALFTPLPNAAWTPRELHSSWTDGSSIFVAGGRDAISGSTFNQVYTSGDGGSTWKNLFACQYAMGMAAVSYQGTQYLLGGRGSLCTDMKVVTAWNPSTGPVSSIPPWSGRGYAMAVVWKPPPTSSLPEQLLFIGGGPCGQSFTNDVWSYTSSGWNKLANGAFAPVGSAGIASIQKGSQIILAGGTDDPYGSSWAYNTVWVGAYSGVTSQLAWTLRCSAAPWSPRTVSLTATADDYLYMIEGASPHTVPVAGSNDVRQSNNDRFCLSFIMFNISHLLCVCLLCPSIGLGKW